MQLLEVLTKNPRVKFDRLLCGENAGLEGLIGTCEEVVITLWYEAKTRTPMADFVICQEFGKEAVVIGGIELNSPDGLAALSAITTLFSRR